VQLGLQFPLALQIVEIFEEQQPRGLLGVIEFGGAAGLFPEHVVDILEGLFEHAPVRIGKSSVAVSARIDNSGNPRLGAGFNLLSECSLNFLLSCF